MKLTSIKPKKGTINNSLIILIVFFALVVCVGAEDFTEFSRPVFSLNIDPPPRLLFSLGDYEVTSVSEHSLVFSPDAGNLCDPVLYDRVVNNFNFDGLYRILFEGKEYFFRFGWQNCSQGLTSFTSLNWANNLKPPRPGQMHFDVVEKGVEQKGTIEISTVGDSIIWWGEGEGLRKFLSLLNPDLKFIGSRTDTYGFGHEGEGGNNSRQVLHRLESIIPCQNYILFIGTNDRFEEEETIKNIQNIIKGLLEKGADRVYLLTILPRTDDIDLRNQRVNKKLREWVSTYKNTKILLVDLEKEFRNTVGWENLLKDGIHPNKQGYKKLVSFIAMKLQVGK